MYFNFSTLLNNVQLMARQTPGRVRVLRTPCGGVIGSAGEQWDEALGAHRLPTPVEFFQRIHTSISTVNDPVRYLRQGPRRELTPREMRLLWRTASGSIRQARKLNLELQ